MTHTPITTVFIGAGEINFGSVEGPWNHSKRLEQIVTTRLRVTALIDPDVGRAQDRVKAKAEDDAAHVRQAWSSTRCFATLDEAAQAGLTRTDVDLIVNGCPPHFRGTLLPGKDMDAQILRAFSEVRVGGILTEKPVAAADPTVHDCQAVADLYRSFSGVVGVGYMLRYLKIVQNVKSIMKEHKITPMCINARYVMAYEFAQKVAWWNKEISCGPVVEQATHFVDLIRYLAGSPVRFDTVYARTVEHDTQAGRLSKIGFDEATLIPTTKRVPRITNASWAHEQGTLSTLTHCVALHGQTYSTEIDIVADGWLLRLSDVYTSTPKLAILRQGANEFKTTSQPDDPFTTQFEAMLHSIANKKENTVLSSYDDALETYRLTWAIRKAGEANVR